MTLYIGLGLVLVAVRIYLDLLNVKQKLKQDLGGSGLCCVCNGYCFRLAVLNLVEVVKGFGSMLDGARLHAFDSCRSQNHELQRTPYNVRNINTAAAKDSD